MIIEAHKDRRRGRGRGGAHFWVGLEVDWGMSREVEEKFLENSEIFFGDFRFFEILEQKFGFSEK